MTVLINDGWLWLNNGTDYLKLACKEITATPMFNTEFTHYVGGNFSIDLGQIYWVFKAKRILFNTVTKLETTVNTLLSWQSANAFTLEIIKDSSDNKLKPNGTDSSYTVRLNKKGLQNLQKVANADGTNCEIAMLVFEEG